jgi:Sulfotransferase family
MTKDATSGEIKRKDSWTPPPRPEWVRRFNEEGHYFDLNSVVPIDEDSILKAVKTNTGLSDFGSDDWYEPFQVLVKSLDQESELTLMGRLMARSDLILYLQARLQIEDTYKRHPEIEDEQIEKPILIVGQGRSGTSALLNILSKDPENGVCKTWEAYFPCPPPEKANYLTDPRIERADKLIQQWNRVVPEMASVHEFTGEIPTETIQLHCLSMQSVSWFPMCSPTPSYSAYLMKCGVLPAFRYEKRTLKLLQWKNPRKHWVLKSPDATRSMVEAMQVYPDITIVWPHRDPVKALSSAVNTLGALAWTRTDRPFRPGTFEHVTNADACNAMMCAPIEVIESNPKLRAQLVNVLYQDFVKTPLAVVEKIYAASGRILTNEGRASMQRYMDDYPRASRPAHAYNIGTPEQIARERIAFRQYQDYFGVPNEL